MTITPQGQLYLCKTPLENDYKNQLTFSSLNAQLTYFNSKVTNTFDNYTYIKKDNAVNVGVNIDEIIDCNYLFYKNIGFSNKWYFCFITNMEYVNENCTKITFETDCFQTWYFQIQYKPTFVEREHVNDDTVGLNILEENLQLGEYVCNKNYKLLHNNDTPSQITNTDLSIVVAATVDTSGSGFTDVGMQVDGIFQGVNYFCFHNTYPSGISALNVFLRGYATQGKLDYIQSIFMVPSFVCQGAEDRDYHKYVNSNLFYNKYVNQ